MRQFDRAAVQAFLREAEAGDHPRRELAAADGSRLVYERRPAPELLDALTEVAPDGTARLHTRTFAAAEAPPAGYPAGGPFVRGRAVFVGDLNGDGNPVFGWTAVADPDALVAELVRASVADGWVEVAPSGGALGRAIAGALIAAARATTGTAFGVRRLVRAGRQRVITAGGTAARGGHVELAEAPAPAGTAAVPDAA